MLEVVFAPRAEDDLIDIWIYTREQWGETQADAYLDQLYSGAITIGAHPEIGVACSQARSGYWRYNINRHRVYYRQAKGAIEVVRILHERMDIDQHFE